jgi:ferritin-like metal-binding protein YciE
MPATLSNPRDLYLALLAEVLFIERMLGFEAIPEMLAKISDPELSGAIAEHLEQTKQHARNVESAFAPADAEVSSNQSRPFVALTEQHAQLSSSAAEPAIADLVHARAALAVEHLEIASYRALLACAEVVAPDAVGQLQENLAQEQQAEQRLRELLGPLMAAADAGAPVAAR